MGRDLDPKCKQCRRAGKKLFLKGERCFSIKCAIVKKNYPPGIHGQKGYSRKMTEYGKQLAAKQVAKKIFRIREKEFRNYFIKANKLKGDVGINLLRLLETRFDNIIYKLGLAESRDQSRQLISHGHFLINKKKVNIPSYHLKVGDIISIREKSKKNNLIGNILKNIKQEENLDWLFYDTKEQKIQVIGMPEEKDFDKNIEIRLIIEFYSR